MMRFNLGLLAVLCGCVCLNGCGSESENTDVGSASSAPRSDDSVGTEEDAPMMDDGAATPAAETPGDAASTGGGSIALTAGNTKVQFVGIHVGDKPDPRTGGFGKITGTAQIDGAALKSLTVEFETASLTTDIDKLTDHLKSPDFFDVKQHPTATFVSTAIETGADGKSTVTGDLTLLGVTKSVSFPATITTEGGLKLNAELSIDRTEFGMAYSPDKVDRMVALTVSIGG